MARRVHGAFKELVKELDWPDSVTKQLVIEKVHTSFLSAGVFLIYFLQGGTLLETAGILSRQAPSHESKKKGLNQGILPTMTYCCQHGDLQKTIVNKPTRNRKKNAVCQTNGQNWKQRSRVTNIVE